jgi:MYXO-CTERM domain-containing protein
MQISRKSSVLVLFASAAAIAGPAVARAAEYYVSPTGSDTSDGTLAAPFATLAKAHSAAAAGDTIWVRGGTYTITTQLVLSKSGTSDSSRTKIWAYPGETPVLDASQYVTSNAAVDVPVVLVTGSWMHLRGLEISNAKVGASGDHSYSLLRTKNASNNTFELLKLHHGFGPGLFIDTGTGGNLILNCDSHDNYDKDGSQGDGQNGDGFGVHYQKTGPSTTIRGCRAWMDSDDGYDLISQEVPVTVEDSFAFQNGYGSDGNGNGFKMGSSQTGIRHLVQNNVAWKNKAAGFYANHSSGGNTWYSNTAYNNGVQYNMLASSFDASGNITGTIVLTGSKAHILRNNVGFPTKNSNMDGVDSSHNTWDLNLAETAADFASTDPTGCDGPRQADGSMPAACTFMKLKVGSPLIDKGTDVGLPFAGAAPDLGAYEYGALPSTGGAGGSAAATGGKGAGGVVSAGGGSGAMDAGAGGILGTGGASRSDAGGGGNAGDTTGAAGGTTTVAAGGSASSGAVGAGGSIAAGGMSSSGTFSGAGGSSNAGGSRVTGGGSPSGCGCALGGTVSTSHRTMLTLVALGLLLRRRTRR